MRLGKLISVLAALLSLSSARAGIVINEIFYHAPSDLDDVQWIELYNTADAPADISGWSLDQGKLFTFPKDTAIAAQGYLVIALKPAQFRQYYNTTAIGPLKHPLKHSGEQIELVNANNERVDVARYKDHDPWPASADGYSASLERISPSASGELAENWAASPLPTDAPRPAGTPGKKNFSFSSTLPPTIKVISAVHDEMEPKKAVDVEVEAKDPSAIKELTLLYRTVADGLAGTETALPMSKDANTGHFIAQIPGQNPNTLLRYRVKVAGESAARFIPAENDLRPTFSTYIHDAWPKAKIPLGYIIHAAQPRGIRGFLGGARGQGEAGDARPPRGTSAFVYVDEKTGKTTLFDHINAPQRSGARGYKIHFQKDNTLNGMTAISVIFEGNERFLLAENFAYDLYRRAGNAAPLSDFMRLYVDGRPVGYHLMIENPNRSFLRRNHVEDTGNLYKIRWFGQGIEGQHAKKTNINTTHQDLIDVIQKLRRTKGDEQWKVIQENFNVDQVATYFAVNMVLSHWDGYFNNYFCYRDSKNKKWEMYPWDQDKTWGAYDGIGPDEVFFNMPLTFGMDGDQRPVDGDNRGGNPFGGGPAWWRPGGYFSAPLLANPQFRRIFLTRVKEILDKDYTEAIYFPLLAKAADRLKEDVIFRSKMHGSDGDYGVSLLDHNIKSLQTHLLKRRAFLLEQPELKALNQ